MGQELGRTRLRRGGEWRLETSFTAEKCSQWWENKVNNNIIRELLTDVHNCIHIKISSTKHL